MSDHIVTPLHSRQVVTIKCGPKAYLQHFTHGPASLIRRQAFEETSFMVGKYMTEQPGLISLPLVVMSNHTLKSVFSISLARRQSFRYTEPLIRGEKVDGIGSAELSRLFYGPVHFQGPARDEQF